MFQQQQQINLKMSQLNQQGIILSPMDQGMMGQMSLQELEHVGEFYEVLDAQLLKLKLDQEQKLKKTNRLRMVVFDIIQDTIDRVFPNKGVKVEIYGSMATGLAIDSSDLDILVYDFVKKDSPRYHQMSRQDLIEEMQKLHAALNAIVGIKTNTLIEGASVPVIKLQMNLVKICEEQLSKNSKFEVKPSELETDEETRVLNIDITFDESCCDSEAVEHQGLKCCKYIKQKLEEFPKMKTLALVFKKFLSLKNMNKPFSGGLSSYSIIQMLQTVLKTEQKMGVAPKLSIGMIFKHFV